jgi:hypothetical protein
MISARSVIQIIQDVELKEDRSDPIYRDDIRLLYSLTPTDETHSRLLDNGRSHNFHVWDKIPYYLAGKWDVGHICSIDSTEALIIRVRGSNLPWLDMEYLIKKASDLLGIEYTGREVVNIQHMTPRDGYTWLEIRNKALEKAHDEFWTTSKMSLYLVPRDQLGWWDVSPKEVVDNFLDKYPELSGLKRSIIFKLAQSSIDPKIFLEADQLARWYETGGRGNEFESELEWYNFEFPVYAPSNKMVYRRVEMSRSEYERLLSTGHVRLENSLLSSWTDEEGLKNFMPSNPRDYAVVLISEVRRDSLDLDATALRYIDWLKKHPSDVVGDVIAALNRGLRRGEREIVMEGNPDRVVTLENSKLLVKDSGGVRLVDHSPSIKK